METNDRSILIFEEAIKSEETRRQYRYLLEKFGVCEEGIF
jgi:hypothetical protein